MALQQIRKSLPGACLTSSLPVYAIVYGMAATVQVTLYYYRVNILLERRRNGNIAKAVNALSKEISEIAYYWY